MSLIDGILQQRLERPEAEDFIENLLDEPLALGHVIGSASSMISRSTTVPICSRTLSLLRFCELVRRERVQQLGVDLALDLEPAVGAGPRRTATRGRATHVQCRLRHVFASFFRRWLCRRRRGTPGRDRPPASRFATNGRALLIDATPPATPECRRTPAGSASAGSARRSPVADSTFF